MVLPMSIITLTTTNIYNYVKEVLIKDTTFNGNGSFSVPLMIDLFNWQTEEWTGKQEHRMSYSLATQCLEELSTRYWAKPVVKPQWDMDIIEKFRDEFDLKEG